MPRYCHDPREPPFDLFSRFPTELQIAIWEFAIFPGLRNSFTACLNTEVRGVRERLKPYYAYISRIEACHQRYFDRGFISMEYPISGPTTAWQIYTNYRLTLSAQYEHAFIVKSAALLGGGSSSTTPPSAPALFIGSISGIPQLLRTCYLVRVTVLQTMKKLVKDRYERENNRVRQEVAAGTVPFKRADPKHEMVLTVVEKVLRQTLHGHAKSVRVRETEGRKRKRELEPDV